MAQCVVISGGAVVESVADPCTGFLIVTPAEYAALSHNPFMLSVEDGLLISGAIAAVWAAAWAWRKAASALQTDGEPQGES
jgi:hypothetical protein